MKKLVYVFLFILLIIFISSSRQNNEIIEGDLYFSVFRFGSFYNQPDSVVNRFKTYADTVNRSNINYLDKKVLTMYELLKQEDLLFSPFI
ncbi:MAG TPA: hypothetical protein VK796_01985, partial [Cytophaga sp.]|nr:hypothetical protein [Cytophaga sp.]